MHNKYRASRTAGSNREREATASQFLEPDAAILPAVRETDNAGCHAYGKCYVCKLPVPNLVVTILNKFSLLISI